MAGFKNLKMGFKVIGRAISKGRIHPIGIAIEAVQVSAEEAMKEKVREFAKYVDKELRKLDKEFRRISSEIKLTPVFDFRYESNLPAVARAFQMANIEILHTWGELVRSEAMLRAPVDTGALRDSIDYKVLEGEGKVIVGSSMDYAAFVELGTSRNRAQPFLEPAIMQNQQKLKAIAEQVYSKHLGGL